MKAYWPFLLIEGLSLQSQMCGQPTGPKQMIGAAVPEVPAVSRLRARHEICSAEKEQHKCCHLLMTFDECV